ncbi:Zn-dependent protease (includes SpoIVFB) [Seinonella peptonophila]|uniref:Zn-dependent protease (Includes SpoIVFB) n=1 Tax=Seinonella peptonophila TaxID=112248 RepID=A0A1M5A783_9BACL|nr:site-2 protease family protein [Seinonella peptonophila]SHF25997.1 Zn-dependent protease (includes SpoIVFB) [Seinonella peptonophila]
MNWLVGIGAIILSFGKTILPLLKFGKFGGTLLTMGLSVWAYAMLYSWQFSIGLVLMIFIHEMGHVLAAKQKGLPASAPAFIPFVGALIMLKKNPQDAETEAYIAYGGPLLGTIGALSSFALGYWLQNDLFYAIALIGFALNLFNLIPIHPLDGGRIVVAVTRWLWGLGLILGLILIFYLQSWILAIVYLFFVYDLWTRLRQENKTVDVEIDVDVSADLFEQEGVLIPGETHRRTLNYDYYCDLHTKLHILQVKYPGIGTIYRLEGMNHGVMGVELIRTTHPTVENPNINMVLKLTVIPEQRLTQDKFYYQVPLKKRWIYGIAYLGLAAVLGIMMFVTSTLIQHPTIGG